MFELAPLGRTLAAARRDLQHRREHVRLAAVEDLAREWGETEADDARALLEGTLRHDPVGYVRARAALGLADQGARQSVEALCAAARDADPKVRQMAVLALGELAPRGHPGAIAAISEALASEAPALRFQGILAATQVLSEDAEAMLFDAMLDEDPQVRSVVLRLAEERWPGDAESAVPQRILERARERVKDTDLSVALAASLLLIAHGDERGRLVLVRVVGPAGRGIAAEDRTAAMRLCAERGWQEACAPLRRSARGVLGIGTDPCAWHARVALARLREPWALASITRGLSAWTRDARTLAVAAAGQARMTELRAALEGMRSDPSRADPHAVEEALALIAETDPP